MTGPLTPREIEAFIESGYVWVRGAISPRVAAQTVADVFSPGGTLENAYKRTDAGLQAHDVVGLPLDDCTAWPANRMDVDTGFQARVSELSPRLLGALQQLVGNAELRRPQIGSRWILNLDQWERPSDPERLLVMRRGMRWHIDTPGPATTLRHRFDGLTLLILWSDVAQLGGGTLYSSQGFGRLVDTLIESPEGIDTTQTNWAAPLIRDCDDIAEMVGRAGDVLITHPFMMHARPHHHGKAVRILENPTFRVSLALDYSPANPAPSPVEEAVIRRIRRHDPIPPHMQREQVRREELTRAGTSLIEREPSRFLPTATETAERDQLASDLERAVFADWIETHAQGLRFHQGVPVSMAMAAIRVARRHMVSQRDVSLAAPMHSFHDAAFFDYPWSRLVLGLSNCEGINYVVFSLARACGLEAHMFEAREKDSSHSLVMMTHEGRWGLFDAWSDCAALWVDGWDPQQMFADWCDVPPLSLSEPFPELKEWSQWTADGATRTRSGLASREAFTRGILAHPLHVKPIEPPADLSSLLEQLDRTPPAPSRLPASWTEYLRLRTRLLAHQEADPAEALRDYLKAHRVGGLTRHLVEQLIRRQ